MWLLFALSTDALAGQHGQRVCTTWAEVSQALGEAVHVAVAGAAAESAVRRHCPTAAKNLSVIPRVADAAVMYDLLQRLQVACALRVEHTDEVGYEVEAWGDCGPVASREPEPAAPLLPDDPALARQRHLAWHGEAELSPVAGRAGVFAGGGAGEYGIGLAGDLRVELELRIRDSWVLPGLRAGHGGAATAVVLIVYNSTTMAGYSFAEGTVAFRTRHRGHRLFPGIALGAARVGSETEHAGLHAPQYTSSQAGWFPTAAVQLSLHREAHTSLVVGLELRYLPIVDVLLGGVTLTAGGPGTR